MYAPSGGCWLPPKLSGLLSLSLFFDPFMMTDEREANVYTINVVRLALITPLS